VAGEVLTAADLNITNSGIPVFESTVERDAAFGGTGEKTLAEGQFAYLETGNVTQYYDGASWQPVGVAPGLVLVKTETVGSGVASVTVTNCFNATYDSYKIVSTGVGASGSGEVNFQLTGLTTAYYGNLVFAAITGGAVASSGYNNIANVTHAAGTDSSALYLNIDVDSPFLAKPTFINCKYIDGTNAGSVTVKQTSSTSATGFTITPASGTLTGGTIRIYGYANS
jgi:hypothetical protein